MSSNNIEFFNLVDGQSAVIRILATSVSKIERVAVHTIDTNNQGRKKVKCLGKDKCPLCKEFGEGNIRLVVHLWDYTDNKEKIWNRTANEKFINLLKDVEENWGNLSECVVKITREGNDFPNYTMTVQNPNKYPFPSEITNEDVDASVGYRICTYRSADELEKYLDTGVLPDHVKKNFSQGWLPKDQWLKQQNEKNQAKKTDEAMASYEASHAKNVQSSVNTDTTDDDDVFIDPFAKPRRGV